VTHHSCPRCTHPLTPYLHAGSQLDHCHRCGGSFLDPGAAAATFGPAADPAFWKQSFVTRDPQPSKLRCPRDARQLDAYIIQFEGVSLEVDECAQCRGMWLDHNEGHALANMIHHAEMHARARREGDDRPGVLSYIFQLFTLFPIEVWNPLRRRPYLVYSLLAILTGLFLGELLDEQWVVEHYADLFMVPERIANGQSLWTLVSAAFFHGGWEHLLSNLYFLWIFGDNVEEMLGAKRFVLLYLAAAIAGNLAHFAVDTSSEIPLLGASGAIAGLMGAYLALFPRVKVWMVILFIRFRLSVVWYLAFWVGTQILMVYRGATGVAWFAHLGGFVCGLAWGLAARKPTERRLYAEHHV
jgi:membrane associated rhomboid family serine protease/Zn-finger nucleic acid-binding protein